MTQGQDHFLGEIPATCHLAGNLTLVKADQLTLTLPSLSGGTWQLFNGGNDVRAVH